jgi:hypothetical protein
MKQVVLLNTLPESLLSFLSDHIRHNEPQNFLIVESLTDKGAFLEMDILPVNPTADEDMTWRVQIPIHFVLAIAQFRPDAKRPIGFVGEGS